MEVLNLSSRINNILAGKTTGNKKNLIYILCGIVLIIVLVCVGSLFMNKGTDTPILPNKNITQEEKRQEELKSLITQNVNIGDTKSTIVTKVGATEDLIGKNYVINPNYTRIGKYDFLTAFIFKDDSLVAIVHERMLDGTQKHNLAVEFQKFSSEIGELYTLIDSKETWYSTELTYDANTWNNAITSNDLEMVADFENSETKDYVKIIASGINYFDFLFKDRENLSVGNLDLIYTSSAYKDDFLGFVSLAAEN